MLKKIKTLLTQPKSVFIIVQGPFKKVVQYLLLTSLFLLLPAFLIALIAPNKLYIDSYDFYKTFEEKPMDVQINNGQINYGTNQTIYKIDTYDFVFAKTYEKDTMGFVFHFGETTLDVYIGNVKIDSANYQQLGMTNINFRAKEDLLKVGHFVNQYLAKNPIFTIALLMSLYMTYILQYVIVALLLATMSRMFTPIPMPFKLRFSISVYLMTIYTALTLVASLLNLFIISYIAIFVAYIYHVKAYRSIKLIGRKKEND